MIGRRRATLASVLLAAGVMAWGAPGARAQDFFSALFGGFAPRPPVVTPSRPMAYGSYEDELRSQPRQSYGGGGRSAYCVRSCDGRYFPLPTSGDSATASCSSLCPASATRVVYGSSNDIDDATTSSGQTYASLPNAFRYRTEMVASCTCNGKDAFGLAQVRIEDDKTLRKGDIVAGANGLVVASGRPDRRNVANFTPAPASIRSKYERTAAPVVASE